MTTRLLVFDDDAAIGHLVTRVAVLGGLAATAVTDTEAFRQSLQQRGEWGHRTNPARKRHRRSRRGRSRCWASVKPLTLSVSS